MVQQQQGAAAALTTPVKRGSRNGAQRRKLAVRSPTDDMMSPLSKVLMGPNKDWASGKEVAKIVFDNRLRKQQQQQQRRTTPLKQSSKSVFHPYRSPSDSILSPATRGVRSRLAKHGKGNDENSNPKFFLPGKAKSFDSQRGLKMLAYKNHSTMKKLARSQSNPAPSGLNARLVNVPRTMI